MIYEHYSRTVGEAIGVDSFEKEETDDFIYNRSYALDQAIVDNVIKKHQINLIKKQMTEELFIDGKSILTIDLKNKTIIRS